MKIGDDEFKRALQKYLDERKPKTFGSMIESMSWYTNTRKLFIEQLTKEGILEVDRKKS